MKGLSIAQKLWVAVIVIVILVQGLQFLGNFLARKTLRR